MAKAINIYLWMVKLYILPKEINAVFIQIKEIQFLKPSLNNLATIGEKLKFPYKLKLMVDIFT